MLKTPRLLLDRSPSSLKYTGSLLAALVARLLVVPPAPAQVPDGYVPDQPMPMDPTTPTVLSMDERANGNAGALKCRSRRTTGRILSGIWSDFPAVAWTHEPSRRIL